MDFWKLAFDMGWVTAEALKGAVETNLNRFGEISPQEYTMITGIEFVVEP
ncbi:hypothetical protein GCM10008908_24800 [Clostridium subterminale]|uniref:XkdX family protein n=1 Tax=Clostridium subterminale TaxID=1550 RepID=A0ABP3W0Y1_CLOSU